MAPLLPLAILAGLGVLVLSKKSSSDTNQSALGKTSDAGSNQDLLNKILQPSSTVKAALASSTDPYVLIMPNIYRMTPAGIDVWEKVVGGWKGAPYPQGAPFYPWSFVASSSVGVAYSEVVRDPKIAIVAPKRAVDAVFNGGKSFDTYVIPLANLPAIASSPAMEYVICNWPG